MRDAIAHDDAEELVKHAHKLKGSMSYFPNEPGTELARAIEQAARAGDLAAAMNLLPELEQAVAALERALSSVHGV
jgi:HPt (histidine-containing phosphotransfer) domain-containing protein